MGYPEDKDIRTGKAPRHQAAAQTGKKGKIPTGKIPRIDFNRSMYVGYNKDQSDYMQLEIKIKNTGEHNEISMSGSEGEIMKTDTLEKRIEDYWTNIDLEDEFGYMADESIGEEPSEEEIESEMPIGTPTMDEDEDAYVDAYEIAYDTAMENHKEKREEYLESIKDELSTSSYPWEFHDEERVNGEFYTMTLHSCGQVLDNAKAYTPVIPAQNLDFIVESWRKHHLFGIGNDEKQGRSEPSLKTMQKLIKICNNYETRGGNEYHVKKIIDGLSI